MASRPSPPKKAKLSDDMIIGIAKEASEVEFPWNDVAPGFFVEWIDEFSCANNVVKEMMMMGILPSVAALLGPRSCIKPSQEEQYKENFSFFSLCISPPSSGKSQAFKHGIKIPVTHVEKESNACILLDKFTDAGLRQHLLQYKGGAAILKDEMYDTLKSIIAEKDVGTLCRLYDGDSLSSNLGNNALRVTTEETCVSLGGFIQVKNFLSEVYPSMVSSKNGFEQRFLYAVVKPKAMTRKESEQHVRNLQEYHLRDLTDIYDAVYRDHADGITYTFSEDALRLYDEFDADVCKILNSKWQLGVLIQEDAEIGKDRRQVIRLAVILYVIYSYTRRALFQSYGSVSRVIEKRYMQYAIELMKYFRKQKKAIDKILDPIESMAFEPQLETKILEHAGGIVNIRTLRNKYNSASRPSKEDIGGAMTRLEEMGMGVLVQSGSAMAFLKQVPSAVDDAQLQRYKITPQSYKAIFCRKNFDLQNQVRENLLSKDPLGQKIEEYLAQNQKE